MMQAQDFPLISHSPKRWAEFVRARTPILESIVPLDSRGWKNMKALGNEDLIAHARWKIASLGVGRRKDLAEADSALYKALRKRGLLEKAGLVAKLRVWGAMGNEELVAHAQEFIAEVEIDGRINLQKEDSKLYQALRRRKLLDAVGLEKKRRDWGGMGDNVLVAQAREFIAERGIGSRTHLAKEDAGLCDVLRRRELMEAIGLPDLRGQVRDWTRMDGEELVVYTIRFIYENGIGGKKELSDADPGLYRVLRKRGLLDEIGIAEKQRSWAGMRNEVLVAHARRVIEEKKIGCKGGLRKADSGLYHVLRRRGLLDSVFSRVEFLKHADAVDGVIAALDSFGDDE